MAEHYLREHFYPDLLSTKATSALFKWLLPFSFYISGLTSGYPQMSTGNGHSPDINDEGLFLFLPSLFWLSLDEAVVQRACDWHALCSGAESMSVTYVFHWAESELYFYLGVALWKF